MSGLDNEGVAAMLGLVIKEVGEVFIPRESVEDGLPENAGVRIEFLEDLDGLLVRIVENE